MDEAVTCIDLEREFVTRAMIGGTKRTVALQGVNLHVPRGSVFGLLGPNGAGKTTTVRILSTLLTPTRGTAAVLGYDVMNDTAQVRRSIGFVLGGDRGLYGRLSARENLEYFAALNHMEPRFSTRRAEELLQTVGLFDRRHDKVETYSRGMKQRLHIARGLLTDPEVVFMDEPTIGLDPQVAQEVRAIIPELRERGKTVLLTTHYMFEADVLCDHLALIDHGRIVAEGSPSEMKRRISRLSVIEIQLRTLRSDLIPAIQAVKGVNSVTATQDGLLHRIIVQAEPDVGAREGVTALLDDGTIESILEREPTLEEAYLRILA